MSIAWIAGREKREKPSQAYLRTRAAGQQGSGLKGVTDPGDGCLERKEAALLHLGTDLSSEATGHGSFVRDDATAGLRNGCCDGVYVPWCDRL